MHKLWKCYFGLSTNLNYKIPERLIYIEAKKVICCESDLVYAFFAQHKAPMKKKKLVWKSLAHQNPLSRRFQLFLSLLLPSLQVLELDEDLL